MRSVLAVCTIKPWFCTNDTEVITPGLLSEFTLEQLFRYKYIVAGRGWEHANKKAVSLLLSYVANGGGVLGYRCEKILTESNALSVLFDARFEGEIQHTDSGIIIYREHTITKIIETFELSGGIKKYKLGKYLGADTLIEYSYLGERYPAMWAHKYCSGRIAFIAFEQVGSEESNNAQKELLKRAVLWIQGKI